MLVHLAALVACALDPACTPEAGAPVLLVDVDRPPGGDGQSWGTAFDELADALDLALVDPSVTEIWVAEGSYLPDRGTGDRAESFRLVSGVALYGGFAGVETMRDERDPDLHPTELSGDLSGDDGPGFAARADNSVHVVTGVGLSARTVLDGFRVRGGHCDLAGSDLGGGAGAWVYGASDLVVAQCLFQDNSTTDSGIGNFGAGLFIEDSNARVERCRFVENLGNAGGGLGLRSQIDGVVVVVAECEFRDNTAYGSGGAAFTTLGSAIANHFCSLTFEQCAFTGNSALWVGALADSNTADLRVVDSTFEDNSAIASAGAIRVEHTVGVPPGTGLLLGCVFLDNFGEFGGAARGEGKGLTVLNSRFHGNVATNRGGALAITQYGSSPSGPLDVQNSVFSGNAATGGGAAWVLNSPSARFVQATIAANAASGTAGGVWLQGSVGTVENSVLWANSRAGVENENAQLTANPSMLALEHTTVQGLSGKYGGDGNLGSDPLFADLAGADGLVGTVDDDVRFGNLSPAIDSGDSLALPSDEFDLDEDGDVDEPLPIDLDGFARVSGATVDRGPYERDCDGVDCFVERYCTSTPNTTGAPALISASGSVSLADASFVLHAGPVPDQPGLFLFGFSPTQTPLGDGFLCVAAPLFRFPAVLATSQELVHPVDFTTPPGSSILVGTFYFQAWFRDPASAGSTFNLSDGLVVKFLP